jgi:hypothetical protein
MVTNKIINLFRSSCCLAFQKANIKAASLRYWFQPKCFAADVSIIITGYSCKLTAHMFNDKVHLMPTGHWLFSDILPARNNASKPTRYSCGC